MPLEASSEPVWAYIATKVARYLQLGAERYRNEDFFKMPAPSWSAEDLVELEAACRQVVAGSGRSAADPLHASVSAVYMLMELVHYRRGILPHRGGAFKITRRMTGHGGDRLLMDEMAFVHRVSSEGQVRVFNIVAYSARE